MSNTMTVQRKARTKTEVISSASMAMAGGLSCLLGFGSRLAALHCLSISLSRNLCRFAYTTWMTNKHLPTVTATATGWMARLTPASPPNAYQA